ncbi:SusD/RagB family nutrient-binding outer membrane lipoprotein [Polaribacter sp. NJDZ03]|uniref:SusD/RagB family nutrient-binding outer membrane lipoprotein n=1 Tax=Polaribacter sp. NJDZ03 TaxID=2855841 RepID=UPI001C4A2340|nr:SusD/RagB family nutrient-binding outer membrane lipoprotein [Polaribacter sp. NJDZ03]
MKLINIKIFIIFSIALTSLSCTSNFENINTDPYGVSNETLEQDYYDLGAFFPGMIRMLVNTTDFKYQIAQNLTTDSWVGYLAPPTPFAGGANNTTYKMVWKNETWNSTYSEIMAPSKQIIERAREKNQPQFEAWAKLIRIYGIQKVASLHGPVIYSNYGASNTVSIYDSEEVLYKKFFEDLDEINKVLIEYIDFEGFKNFDIAYNGNVSQWLKLSNSLRLMLAMRLSNVDPQLAQEQAEKATSHQLGVLESNADNFQVQLGSERHPLNTIGYSYNDTRMSATMESFLVGFRDQRISKFFAPVTGGNMEDLVASHPEYPYKGVKNGAILNAKEKRVSFSKPGVYFTTNPDYIVLSYSNINFMLAEARLRGWDVGVMSVKDYYEEGVKASFQQWGAEGVDDYLSDDVSKPIDYKDPAADVATENAFDAQTNITIMWDETSTNSIKLERIITQKWIAGFPNSNEAWVDFRRTGFPAIEPVYKNDSDSGDGVVLVGEHIKRMRFIEEEYAENPKGIDDVLGKINGPDKISTRLWWDVNGL